MRKVLPLLMLLPIALSSCSSGVSFDQVKAKIDTIEYEALYPYYRVYGYLDFNGELTQVNSTFSKEPVYNDYVAYARYNEGFYCPAASANEAAYAEDPDQVVIYAMASHSYWLRAPLRLHKENFYVLDEDGKENKTCGHYILETIINSFLELDGASNPPQNKVCYTFTENGGFTVEAKNTHSKVMIDNYPYYPDPETHPGCFGIDEETGEPFDWDPTINPLPCYNLDANVVNGKFNIRFEYDENGWLVKESLKTTDYDYNNSTKSQVALEAIYSYKFE